MPHRTDNAPFWKVLFPLLARPHPRQHDEDDQLPRPGARNTSRLVSFSTVTVREYDITLDQSNDDALYPITLAWGYKKEGRQIATEPPVVRQNESAPNRRVIFPSKSKYAPESDSSVMTESTRSIDSCDGTEQHQDEEHAAENDNVNDDDVDDDDDDFTYRTSVDDFERCHRSPHPLRSYSAEERRLRLQFINGWSRRQLIRYERSRNVRLAIEYAESSNSNSNSNSKKSSSVGKELYSRFVRDKYLI